MLELFGYKDRLIHTKIRPNKYRGKVMAKKANDNIGPSTGLMALMHKTVYFILYPFRKPIKFFIGLAVIIVLVLGLPLFYGVAFKDIPMWYKDKSKEINISQLTQNISSKETLEGISSLVEAPKSKPFTRRSFGRGGDSSEPEKLDMLSHASEDVVDIADIENDEQSIASNNSSYIQYQDDIYGNSNAVDVYYEQDAGVVAEAEAKEVVASNVVENNLYYLEAPKQVAGKAKVHNANELEVNDTYIFLYGIYSSPYTKRGVKANLFLKKLLKEEEIYCDIVAYSQDNTAIGNCFIGDLNINNLMVEEGYSDKVEIK